MKKTVLVVLLCLLCSLSIFAGYRLDLFAMDPLHDIYMADRNRSSLGFSMDYLFDGFPASVMQDQGTTEPPEVFLLKDYDIPMHSTIYVGETLSLFRNTFTFDNWLSPISFDFSIQFQLKFVHDVEITDLFGQDGVYFFGGTMSLADMFSLRIGLHHYSSHYGDAVFKNLESVDVIDSNYKYIRMNSFVVALSVEPVDGIRLYGEYSTLAPGVTATYKPYMFSPFWYDTYCNTGYPDTYNARIINFGAEFSYPIFKKLGKTTIAYDCHMYEEGKIRYRDASGELQDPVYDKDAPWEVEHGVVLAQEVNDLMSLEIGYFNGRHLLNNFYFQRSSYLRVGMRIDFDGSVTLYNSTNKQ